MQQQKYECKARIVGFHPWKALLFFFFNYASWSFVGYYQKLVIESSVLGSGEQGFMEERGSLSL